MDLSDAWSRAIILWSSTFLTCQTYYPDPSLCVFYHTASSRRRVFQRTVPERIYPQSWSGCWCATAHLSPLALQRMISPPASPPVNDMTGMLHGESSPWSPLYIMSLSRCMTGQYCPSQRECLWSSRVAPPTFPPLWVSEIRPLDVLRTQRTCLRRIFWTHYSKYPCISRISSTHCSSSVSCVSRIPTQPPSLIIHNNNHLLHRSMYMASQHMRYGCVYSVPE